MTHTRANILFIITRITTLNLLHDFHMLAQLS